MIAAFMDATGQIYWYQSAIQKVSCFYFTTFNVVLVFNEFSLCCFSCCWLQMPRSCGPAFNISSLRSFPTLCSSWQSTWPYHLRWRLPTIDFMRWSTLESRITYLWRTRKEIKQSRFLSVVIITSPQYFHRRQKEIFEQRFTEITSRFSGSSFNFIFIASQNKNVTNSVRFKSRNNKINEQQIEWKKANSQLKLSYQNSLVQKNIFKKKEEKVKRIPKLKGISWTHRDTQK